MKFKKGELSREAYIVIMHDLECLILTNTESNKYHYDLLKGNLKDIFGVSEQSTKQSKDFVEGAI